MRKIEIILLFLTAIQVSEQKMSKLFSRKFLFKTDIKGTKKVQNIRKKP
jgi:hypothetical protein